MTYTGVVQRGFGEASRSWNWQSIKEGVQDESIHEGTINVRMDDYPSFEFRCDIPFPGHTHHLGREEGLRFQRCRIRVGKHEAHAYVVKTDCDYWGQYGTIEVVAPPVEGAIPGVPIEVIIPPS